MHTIASVSGTSRRFVYQSGPGVDPTVRVDRAGGIGGDDRLAADRLPEPSTAGRQPPFWV
jgi:hypothetical protein